MSTDYNCHLCNKPLQLEIEFKYRFAFVFSCNDCGKEASHIGESEALAKYKANDFDF